MNSHEIYFTSDTHFGHKRMAFEWRGFSSVEEMDEVLIQRWNEIIPPGGHVFHLGDVSFLNRPKTESILAKLNGNKYLIWGNHDHANSKGVYKAFAWCKDYYKLKVEDTGQKIMMCHYPFRTWDSAHYGSWNVHGHCHGNIAPIGGQIDVGVDTHYLRPYTYAEVAAIMATRPYVAVDHHEVME